MPDQSTKASELAGLIASLCDALDAVESAKRRAADSMDGVNKSMAELRDAMAEMNAAINALEEKTDPTHKIADTRNSSAPALCGASFAGDVSGSADSGRVTCEACKSLALDWSAQQIHRMGW